MTTERNQPARCKGRRGLYWQASRRVISDETVLLDRIFLSVQVKSDVEHRPLDPDVLRLLVRFPFHLGDQIVELVLDDRVGAALIEPL